MGFATSRGSTFISRVMIFIDGHYFEKRVAEKYDGEINYSNVANLLIRSSNFGTPTLVRCYYYDGLPDPEQNLTFLEESEQTQRKNELKLLSA